MSDRGEVTVSEAIRAATERLSKTSDTARLDAELLMAHALGVSRSDMLLGHGDGAVPNAFEALVERRAVSEPIAYIIGVQEFYGREFAVEPGVLIPRGDSETLIEAAIAVKRDAGQVLDLGTGSGALLVTALLELGGASGIGLDASAEALEIAETNARALGLGSAKAKFAQRDWNAQGWADGLPAADLILCNPPYVEADAPLDRDVRDFEPAEALFAGEDGLDDYRVLIPQLRKLMNQDAVAIFEIGHTQAAAVTKLAENAGFTTEIRNDLANRPRCAILR